MKLKTKQPFATHFEDSEGNRYQIAFFDGYSFGDRQLEGVMFKAELLADGHLEVSSVENWKTDPYLKTLQEKHWLPLALNFAIENDLFQITITGDGDKDELSFAGLFVESTHPDIPANSVKLSNILDILGS